MAALNSINTEKVSTYRLILGSEDERNFCPTKQASMASLQLLFKCRYEIFIEIWIELQVKQKNTENQSVKILFCIQSESCP